MRILQLLFFLMLSSALSGQYNAFINLGIEEGLAQSQVNDVAHDESGYLWIATASGLSRYDGSEIKNFYKSDGLVDNVVTSILIGEKGTIFFGALGGFSIYQNGSFKAYPFPTSLIDSRVQHMQLLNDKTLWLATNRDGYFSFSLASEEFSVPILDQGTNVRWMDINAGIIAGRDGLYSHDMNGPQLIGFNISDVHQEGSRLWVSTLGEGLWVYEEEWKMISKEVLPNSSYLRDILVTESGEFWGVGPDGALMYKDGDWKQFNNQNGLNYENLRGVEQDNEGNIWLASNGQGLFRFAGNLFNNYVKDNPLHSDIMLSAVESSEHLYLGMFDDRLQRIDRSGTIESLEPFIRTDVWAMLRDSHGRVWAGTSSGLYRSVDGIEFIRLFEDELPSNRITALHEDEFGNICIGHREGLTVVYSDQELYHYTEETGFDGKRIRAIQQSIDGAMWVGAQNGLYRIDGDWILKLDESNGLNDNTIYSIQDDPFGRLWVGAKNGLHVLMQDSVVQIMLSGQVDANNINFLHCTAAGYLFIGTNQGLFVAVIKEKIGDITFEQFGIGDGLPGLECNLNAIYQDSRGDIWFGTNKGVVRFNEEEFAKRRPLVDPVLHITGIRLFAEAFDYSTKTDAIDSQTGLPIDMTLRTDENHITIDFKGIRMLDPEAIRYEYMMEGLDKAWNSAGSATSITYSSLSFGDYCFKVRCVDLAGTQTGNDAEIRFNILAPLFLRWWAIVLEVLILLALIYLLIRWRSAVRRRNESLIELSYRNRMQSLEQQSLNSSMNRHFIFNSLNAIQYYINREDKRSANRYLSSFARLIRKNLDSTATTWVTLKDEIERLELYLNLENMRFKDKFSYKMQIDDAIDAETIRVPSMMLQPFVENSIWHGILPKEEKGTVDIDVMRVNGRMRIRIEDDGIGIDQSRSNKDGSLPDHESKGMDITHHRLRLYSEMTGTDFEIQGPEQIEAEGKIKGTRIDLWIPLSKNDDSEM